MIVQFQLATSCGSDIAINSIDDISVEGCDGDDPQLTWIRGKIIKAIKSQPLSDIVLIEQKRNIEHYYIPYCLNRLEIDYGSHDGKEVKLSITVNPDGSIKDVVMKGSPVDNSPYIRDMLKEEIKKWKVHGSGSEHIVNITFKVKSRKL